jgi:hypothetical protein
MVCRRKEFPEPFGILLRRNPPRDDVYPKSDSPTLSIACIAVFAEQRKVSENSPLFYKLLLSNDLQLIGRSFLRHMPAQHWLL